MQPGDIIPMKSCVAIEGNASLSYRAPKDRLFTFLMLGAQPADGGPTTSPDERLNALGWYFVPDARDQETIQIDGVLFERRPTDHQTTGAEPVAAATPKGEPKQRTTNDQG